MEQFEELMKAAAGVSSATRPLLLYYGLMQAGLAVSTAHTPDPWSFSRHGLTLGDLGRDLAEICVQPSGTGGFQTVAAAAGSGGLAGPVSIGALWASLPELCEVDTLPDSTYPVALPLVPYSDAYAGLISKFKLPPNESIPYTWPRATVYTKADIPEDENLTTWAESLIARYPSARECKVAPYQSFELEAENSKRREIIVEWPRPDLTGRMSPEQTDAFFDDIAPEYRYRNDRYLRPSVYGADDPPSPLMTWWLLLYCFSVLARYRPREWTEYLDLDKSLSATSLEFALDTAMVVVPHLVFEALDRQPVLLDKHRKYAH